MTKQMVQAASDLLDSLPADLQSQAHFAFDDPARANWAFYPREMANKENYGVPLWALDPHQGNLALKLLAAGLSTLAYGKVAAIRSLDLILDERENYQRTQWRDPNRYWVAVYGEPGETGTWAWSFEGHHVSVNHTITDGRAVSSTPIFLGASPFEFGDPGHPIMRPLGDEEEAARTLVASLSEEQMEAALLDPNAPIDMVVPNVSQIPDLAIPGDPHADLPMFQDVHLSMPDDVRHNLRLEAANPRGLPLAQLDGSQQTLLTELVGVYLGRLPADLLASERARLDNAGWTGMHFAWAGTTERRGPHYYRIHSQDLLIEYNCVQDDATHIHAVWRNPRGDFGEDPLRSHLKRGH